MRILLTEGNAVLGQGVRANLRRRGYATDWFQDSDTALRALKVGCYTLVILDAGVPRMSGLALLQWIRDRGDATPAILTTARDEVMERIHCLDCGADDCIVKPFAMEELTARIRAVERRVRRRTSLTFTHRDVTLDPITMTVTHKGKPVRISSREYVLLLELLENIGVPISRKQFEDLLRSWGDVVDSNTISFHIHQLRKKLGADFISTRCGFGYIIEAA